MSSRIISFELVVIFLEIVSQRVEVRHASKPVENMKHFLAIFCVQALGRWIEFPDEFTIV